MCVHAWYLSWGAHLATHQCKDDGHWDAPVHPPKCIYSSLAYRDNVLHISFQHLMQKRVALCVQRHSTIKPRGEPFSASPALIKQTWCAQILITPAHMCILLHCTNDTQREPRCCSHLLLPEKTKAGTGKRTKWMHMDAHRTDLGDWQER